MFDKEPENSDELREQYHALVENGLTVGDFDFDFDSELMHKVVDQHVNKLEAVEVGEAIMTAGDMFIGRILYGHLKYELENPR